MDPRVLVHGMIYGRFIEGFQLIFVTARGKCRGKLGVKLTSHLRKFSDSYSGTQSKEKEKKVRQSAN